LSKSVFIKALKSLFKKLLWIFIALLIIILTLAYFKGENHSLKMHGSFDNKLCKWFPLFTWYRAIESFFHPEDIYHLSLDRDLKNDCEVLYGITAGEMILFNKAPIKVEDAKKDFIDKMKDYSTIKKEYLKKAGYAFLEYILCIHQSFLKYVSEEYMYSDKIHTAYFSVPECNHMIDKFYFPKEMKEIIFECYSSLNVTWKNDHEKYKTEYPPKEFYRKYITATIYAMRNKAAKVLDSYFMNNESTN
jgi:hypothetical protein